MQRKLDRQTDDLNIPLAQRRGPASTLADIQRTDKKRNEAILKAHATGHYSCSATMLGLTPLPRAADGPGFIRQLSLQPLQYPDLAPDGIHV